MTEEERTALLAAMYDPEEEKTDKKTLQPLEPTGKKSRRVVMGAVKYDVPTVEYVEQLEKRVIELERRIQIQDRISRKFDMMISRLTQALRNHGSVVNEISHSLDNKIDRRDI